MDFCEKYPVYHYRIIRTHIMKMLFKYSNIHVELRDQLSVSYTIEEFRAVCRLCREFIAGQERGEDAYPVSWYNRHRFDLETGQVISKKPVNLSDQMLNLKSSFLGGDEQWECGENNECGIFDSLNLFGGDN